MTTKHTPTPRSATFPHAYKFDVERTEVMAWRNSPDSITLQLRMKHPYGSRSTKIASMLAYVHLDADAAEAIASDLIAAAKELRKGAA